MYKVIFTLFVTALLAGCSNFQISEREINEKAENWIGKGQQITLGKSVFLPSLIPNGAYFSISEKSVKLNLNATLEIRSFLGNKAIASGVVVMSGVPYLDKSSGKIFIKKYNIEHVEMTTPNGKAWTVKGEVFDLAKQSIANYVEQMPIYDINKNNKLSGVILSQIETIKLTSGNILLVM